MLKRNFCELESEGARVSGQEFRWRPPITGTMRDMMNTGPTLEILESFIQKVVREEVERAVDSSPRLNLIESSGTRKWQLRFVTMLPPTLFTNNRIESVDGQPIKVVLLDATSQKIITLEPLSSMKLEILVIDGDFVANGEDDWDEKDFHAKIVKEREGKRPLLTGDVVVSLRDGVGYVGDISLTDNSSWIRSRRFRLGARMLKASSEVRIREAVGEAFVVKDHRGESYKKHYPPHLDDDLWRLDKIAKDGPCYIRLSSRRICTVRDFLRVYFSNRDILRDILGSGISNKTWGTIIGHAKTCVINDGKWYLYYSTTERAGLLLNSVYNVVGMTFDCKNYQSLDNLSVYHMQLVEDLKRRAYQSVNEFVLVDEPSFVGHQMLLPAAQSNHINSSCLDLHDVNVNFNGPQDQLGTLVYNQLAVSPNYTYEVADRSLLAVSLANSVNEMQLLTPKSRSGFIEREPCYGPYDGEDGWVPGCSSSSVALTGNLNVDDCYQFEASTWQGNGLFTSPSAQAQGILSTNPSSHGSKKATPKIRWRKIQTAIKWWICFRRIAAIRRMSNMLYFNV